MRRLGLSSSDRCMDRCPKGRFATAAASSRLMSAGCSCAHQVLVPLVFWLLKGALQAILHFGSDEESMQQDEPTRVRLEPPPVTCDRCSTLVCFLADGSTARHSPKTGTGPPFRRPEGDRTALRSPPSGYPDPRICESAAPSSKSKMWLQNTRDGGPDTPSRIAENRTRRENLELSPRPKAAVRPSFRA
jgi:hypothetical protein